MNNKILLTGANGFLGSHFYEYLKKYFIIDTLGRSNNNIINCDISKRVPKLNSSYKIVIHSAGKAHSIPKTQKEKDVFFDVNYKGTVNLCKALENNSPENFVFISTIAVYGLEKGTHIKENTPLNGNSSYAKSKIKAELYLQKWATKNKVNLIVLRLPLVAGKDPKGNLASMINGIKKGYYFNIKGLNTQKSIVLANDVAKLIPNIFEKNGIYNLSGDKDYTFKEISQIIAKQLDKNKIIELPYNLVKVIAFLGDFFSFLPINTNKFKKITSHLTISSKKAIKDLKWNASDFKTNFRIK